MLKLQTAGFRPDAAQLDLASSALSMSPSVLEWDLAAGFCPMSLPKVAPSVVLPA